MRLTTSYLTFPLPGLDRVIEGAEQEEVEERVHYTRPPFPPPRPIPQNHSYPHKVSLVKSNIGWQF
jgi:hypothetical protein